MHARVEGVSVSSGGWGKFTLPGLRVSWGVNPKGRFYKVLREMPDSSDAGGSIGQLLRRSNQSSDMSTAQGWTEDHR